MKSKKGKRSARPSTAITCGRPPLAKRSASLSSRATRILIRSHHELLKAHTAAVAAADNVKATAIESQIAAKGGLESYQLASRLGQSSDRGGDSSKILIEWMKPVFEDTLRNASQLRMLEVGALSTQNACSKIPCLDIDRIDLNSQEAGIREIDFMDLPQPISQTDKYDLISLSLVLNFVPDAAGRGEMLRRIPSFLSEPAGNPLNNTAPCLFLVLPLPCVANSRYLDEARLKNILQSLGLALDRIKKTSQLYYSLWKYTGSVKPPVPFIKRELRSGKSRNNFAIVLR